MTDETPKVVKTKATAKKDGAKRSWGPRPVYKGIKNYMEKNGLSGSMTVDELLAHLRETIVDGS